MTSALPRLVVGTAGHIDHGKSRLVWSLTGTDPDRLPEEKARGMTIDLGFAHTRTDAAELWFVDVPGHERFVRNLLAGATGIDAALLAVAADDSVMPQTREHAELLSLLGVERVVVALTKMDLVDEAWADQVQAEVAELLAALSLRPVAFVRTSCETGRGLDELRRALETLARRKQDLAGHPARSWFRMPIDRAFNVAGRGVVVTGSVLHGRLAADDVVELWPAGRPVRARGLQTHHESAAQADGRMRLAVNLAGVSLEDVGRGCELATPGYLTPAQRLDVRLSLLRLGRRPGGRLRARLHLATAETLTEVRLAERPAGDVVRGVVAQLRTFAPVVSSWGQRFILRDESSNATLGGGMILRPCAAAWSARNPPTPVAWENLGSESALRRLEQVIRDLGWETRAPADIASRAGLPDVEAVPALCRELHQAGRVIALGGGCLVHVDELSRLGADLQRRLRAQRQRQPRWPGAARGEWAAWAPRACPARVVPALVSGLAERGFVALVAGRLCPPQEHDALPEADQRLLDEMLRALHESAYQPPTPLELACVTPRNRKRAQELLELALARGLVVRVAEGIFLSAARWEELASRVLAWIDAHGGLSIADLRGLTQSSRKYLVPMAELLDAHGLTRRKGDLRVRANKPAGPA